MLRLRKYATITILVLSMSLAVIGGVLSLSAVSADGPAGKGCEAFAEPLPDDIYEARSGFDQRGDPFHQIVTDNKHPDGHYEGTASAAHHNGDGVVDTSDFNIWNHNNFGVQGSGFSCIPDTVTLKLIDQNDAIYRYD